MDETPRLALPLIAADQDQKHVTHNEALMRLDALLHCAVIDRDLGAPPASPADGDRYLVAAGAAGAWAGRAGQLAIRDGTAWLFADPRVGTLVFVIDEDGFYVRTTAGWLPLEGGSAALQNLPLLGVGTTADAANPFTAKLNKALWTARSLAEGGDGDLRYTLNKESAADVLSFLFQTGYSGRAELGLIGDDRLRAKVSADGATWTGALAIDPATGGLDFRAAEATLAASATCDIGSTEALLVTITGTASVTSFGSASHRLRFLRFASAVTLVHDPISIGLPGGETFVTGAGDTAVATSDATGRWTVRHYARADVAPRGALRPGSYTVATLPAAGTAGRVAWCSDGRAIGPGGALEGSPGRGCLVTDTGTTWTVAGTNIAVAA